MRELTIIIPFFNGQKFIQTLVNSIGNTIPIIIVNDKSDEPLQLIPQENITIYDIPKKGYFTGACNYGIGKCETDVLILNQDVVLSDGWQDVIENNQDKYALIGERIKGNHPVFPKGYIHGTFMYIRRDLINDIGTMDDSLYPLWGSTAEYQLRASRKGYNVLPLETVPGFSHLRNSEYGDSISSLLKRQPQQRNKFIKTPPEVSVIIVCHNYGRYLEDAVNSLLGGQTSLGNMPGQTFNSFEIIIVDDGSDDENKELIASYSDPWRAIKVIRIKRNPIDSGGKYIGKPSALNIGINHARGKYINILDADDMMDSRRLGTLYRIAEQNPNSVVYDQLLAFRQNSTNVIDENKQRKVDTTGLSKEEETALLSRIACENPRTTILGDDLSFYFWPLPNYNFEELIYKNCMHISIFYPKEAWAKVGGYNEKMQYGREDWCMNVALGLQGYCGIKTEQPFYLYRREGQNRTLENSKPAWQKRFAIEMNKIYDDVYKGYRPMACCGKGGKSMTQGQIAQRTASFSQTGTAPDGMTYVKYVGKRTQGFSTWGWYTGIQYRVNPMSPIFLVDNQDLVNSTGSKSTGILQMYEGNNLAYETYEVEEPEPVAMAIEVETVEEPEKTEYTLTDDLINRLDTVNTVKDFLARSTYTIEDLEALLTYESENKQRVTVIRMLEESINEFDGTSLFERS